MRAADGPPVASAVPLRSWRIRRATSCGRTGPNAACLNAAALRRGLLPRAVGQRHRLVGALQEFDGHEDHVLVAQVFQIVDFELTWPVGLVPGLAWGVGIFDRGAVMHVLASAAARHRRPEIIEHVAMEADPFAGLEPDGPDPHAI